jgi:23S rRNA (cytidine1920-2'-O)/16S rRNA (cytidine1409-2'-O)-methyltransferase
LRQVLEPACACLAPGADVVALVKPQFEVGRGLVGKGGIVRDPAQWDRVLADLVEFAVSRRLGPTSIARSALPGASGNVEFFLHLRPDAEPSAMSALQAERQEAVHAAVR